MYASDNKSISLYRAWCVWFEWSLSAPDHFPLKHSGQCLTSWCAWPATGKSVIVQKAGCIYDYGVPVPEEYPFSFRRDPQIARYLQVRLPTGRFQPSNVINVFRKDVDPWHKWCVVYKEMSLMWANYGAITRNGNNIFNRELTDIYSTRKITLLKGNVVPPPK